jgi:ethanolamine utilization microcompartment shell protein EutS
MAEQLKLRAYAFIDSMHPQYCALTGTVIKGDIPLPGQAELYLEITPGSEVIAMLDVALKASDAKPGFQIVEREFGEIEIHSSSIESVKEAGKTILRAYNLNVNDRVKPKVISSKIISNVDAYQAQLINRFRNGNLLLPNETLFILEVEPASYIVIAANEAEKAANVKIIDFDPVGRYGRLYVSGKQSDVEASLEAAIISIDAIDGV